MATTQYHGLGRRKTSVARVWLKPGAGTWNINGRALDEYFPRHSHQQHAQEPLAATELQGRFDVHVNVDGGGQTGQGEYPSVISFPSTQKRSSRPGASSTVTMTPLPQDRLRLIS